VTASLFRDLPGGELRPRFRQIVAGVFGFHVRRTTDAQQQLQSRAQMIVFIADRYVLITDGERHP
jgi:hypothetical protein